MKRRFLCDFGTDESDKPTFFASFLFGIVDTRMKNVVFTLCFMDVFGIVKMFSFLKTDYWKIFVEKASDDWGVRFIVGADVVGDECQFVM